MDISYDAGKDKEPTDYQNIEECFSVAVDVVETAFENYENPAIMWTGGKDSTLTLYIVQQVAEDNGYELPKAIFIDHHQHFEEVHNFVERWSETIGMEVIYASNDDVAKCAEKPNDEIQVENLNERNRNEVREVLGYQDETFPFLLDTEVGNHLLKTVPFHQVVQENEFDAVFSGVRWDEQEARSDETFFSPRKNEDKYPPHDRVHPILPFTEERLWDAMWNFVVPDYVESYPKGYVPDGKDDLPKNLEPRDLPVSLKYFDGYRSLGSEVSTDKNTNTPAWKQDLDTEERAGRAQDKEGVMERLRDLGYM
jgi:phosphoadenosine phosphosulfate reductase